jgi:hypothetical protein
MVAVRPGAAFAFAFAFHKQTIDRYVGMLSASIDTAAPGNMSLALLTSRGRCAIKPRNAPKLQTFGRKKDTLDLRQREHLPCYFNR